ncbi:LEPR-XLL domain-containing protein [Burkholderia contaminans]|nr:LEPR-XLL domain-containing protein [Burkholderia contaminans]
MAFRQRDEPFRHAVADCSVSRPRLMLSADLLPESPRP